MSLQSYLYVVTVGQLNYKPNTFSCFEVVPRDESARINHVRLSSFREE